MATKDQARALLESVEDGFSLESKSGMLRIVPLGDRDGWVQKGVATEVPREDSIKRLAKYKTEALQNFRIVYTGGQFKGMTVEEVEAQMAEDIDVEVPVEQEEQEMAKADQEARKQEAARIEAEDKAAQEEARKQEEAPKEDKPKVEVPPLPEGVKPTTAKISPDGSVSIESSRSILQRIKTETDNDYVKEIVERRSSWLKLESPEDLEITLSEIRGIRERMEASEEAKDKTFAKTLARLEAKASLFKPVLQKLAS